MSRRWPRPRGTGRYRARSIPRDDAPITGYLDQRSRLDYLRQKVAAENRMRAHDAQDDPEVRSVYNAAGTVMMLMELWRRGCRTFDQAERAMAGVWDGRC